MHEENLSQHYLKHFKGTFLPWCVRKQQQQNKRGQNTTVLHSDLQKTSLTTHERFGEETLWRDSRQTHL